MDPSRERAPEDVRIAAIRHDIEMTRARIAQTIDALTYKVDVPARLADVLSTTASGITARVLHRIPTSARSSAAENDDGAQPAAVVQPFPDGP